MNFSLAELGFLNVFLCSGDGNFDFASPVGVQECIQLQPFHCFGDFCSSTAGSAPGAPLCWPNCKSSSGCRRGLIQKWNLTLVTFITVK